MKLFSVHDSKAENFMNPITFRNIGEASRAFETTCKDPNSQFNMYPTDYTLFHIGDYNPDNGALIPLDKHIPICHGTDFVQ